MAKWSHISASPYPKNSEHCIIDKKSWKGERLLLGLALCAVLLAVAAQSIVSGLLGLQLIFLRRQWPFSLPHSESLRAYKSLCKTLVAFWCVLILSATHHALVVSSGGLGQYLHLLSKQGVSGLLIITSFYLASAGSDAKSWMKPSKMVAGFCVLLMLYMIGQRYFGWDWVHGWNGRLGDNRFAYGVYRASGFMGHPLSLAYNAMILFLLSLSQAFRLYNKAQKREGNAWLLLSVVLFAILALTDSRFPVVCAVGLGFTLGILQLLNRKGGSPRFFWGLIGSLVILASLAFCLLPAAWFGRWSEFFDPSIPWQTRLDRFIFWKIHIKLFLAEPIWGVGLESYPARLLDTYNQAGYTDLERKYNAHNIYLQTLADSGLVGAVGLGILFFGLGRIAIRVNKTFNHPGMLVLLAATLLSGLAQNNLRDSEYLFGFWTGLGLCFSWLNAHRREDDSERRSQLEDNQRGADRAAYHSHVRKPDAGLGSH